MGSKLGTTEEPTQITTLKSKMCSLCLSRYERARQPVCICNHCSLPLCADCLRDHIDELPQSVAQLSHQLHELEQLFQSKQDMVKQEVSKSTTEVTQCIKTYQNDLMETHQTIIVGVENAKQDAKEYLDKIHSNLQAIKTDIKTLAEESIFQPKRMEVLLTQLNQIHKQLETYEMTKDTELQITMPKYKIKFQCIPTSTTDTTESSDFQSTNIQDNAEKKSGHRNNFHPYKKVPTTVRKKNISSQNGETDYS